MNRKEAIQSAYKLAGSNSFYDGMIACSTFSGKAVCHAVWGMGKAECDDYLTHALSGIPTDFSGRLLEVPVGTGVLTMPVYQTLPHGDITCLDYSPDMMGQAQEKAKRCPIAEFAKQHDLLEVMPAMCNPDYTAMELLHARLVRTNTCAIGDKCDYTICGDRNEYLKEHPEYVDEAGFRRNT